MAPSVKLKNHVRGKCWDNNIAPLLYNKTHGSAAVCMILYNITDVVDWNKHHRLRLANVNVRK